VHQVGNQPRLHLDARSTSHQDIPFYLNTVLHFNQRISPGPRQKYLFHNKDSFYGEVFLVPRPNPKLDDHPLSVVLDCLFNIFVATFHAGDRSSIRNLGTRHVVVTGIGEVYTGFW
jgi:hypothetical protein